MNIKMSTVLELGRCKVSAEAFNGGRGHAILLTIASWAASKTVTCFPRRHILLLSLRAGHVGRNGRRAPVQGSACFNGGYVLPFCLAWLM